MHVDGDTKRVRIPTIVLVLVGVILTCFSQKIVQTRMFWTMFITSSEINLQQLSISKLVYLTILSVSNLPII